MKNLTPPPIPLWKPLLIIAAMLAAAMFILFINVYVGAALFISGAFLQAYPGFSHVQPAPGETRGRFAALGFAWILMVVLSAAMQALVPQFTEVFNSFGAVLPLPTLFSMKAYPGLLILPLLAALAWNFWPRKQSRLRAAAIFCWAGVAVNLLMFASMYLPVFKLGSVI